ncbi:WD40 repeat domain-containing protein [Ktedonobacter robiniae]|uniref:Translation initiation factor beta propellor-like domain-containing protein n=1 Tax=Ktedonobacter robiniae TaxID=2778365 RepID=A0ABQ3UMS5_9CHLR|nr:WD40 repeat domain-containing protein [Ktedonobacter robiniae]GHO54051.1 hypothetical protein KSB_25260 [Ktedonobacter robiniae]
MTEHNNQFTPEDVDAQIEHFAGSSREQSRLLSNAHSPDERLVADLQLMYHQGAPRAIADEDEQSLRHAWERIAMIAAVKQARRPGRQARPNARNAVMTQADKQPKNVMNLFEKRTWQQRIGLIAAACVIVLVVGSMVLLFNAARIKNTSTVSGPYLRPTVTPTIASNSSIKLSKNVGKVVYTWNGPQHGQLEDFYDLAWSEDGKRIASAAMNVAVWDATTGQNSVLLDPVQGSQYGSGSILAVKWSPNGKYVASTYGGQILIWNPATKTILQKLTYPGVPVASTATSNSKYLNSYAPLSGGVMIYNFAWSPDGKSIVAANPFHNGTAASESMIIWDVATQKVTTRIIGHTDDVSKIAWSPDGKYIASSAYDGTVRIWDAQNGHSVYKLNAPGKRDYAALAWSPTSKRLLIGFSGGTLESIDATNGTHPLKYSIAGGNTISSVAWSPDGKMIAVAGKGVKLFDAQKDALLYTYSGDANGTRCMAWSPDGKYIATSAYTGEGSSNASVKVWIAK